jgi:cysteine-rich repeat protein
VCGDGHWIEALEGCDDGNIANGDGCSRTCEVEDGWTCESNPPNGTCIRPDPSECFTTCGDGIRAGSEECDVDAEGCGEGCKLECGWRCDDGSCAPVCGDGVTAGEEECDDYNTRNGDGTYQAVPVCFQIHHFLCVVCIRTRKGLG